MATKYMHTITGNPAYFSQEHEQIYRYTKYGLPVSLADSLRQLRREQQKSIRSRRALGLDEDGSKYGYSRVAV